MRYLVKSPLQVSVRNVKFLFWTWWRPLVHAAVDVWLPLLLITTDLAFSRRTVPFQEDLQRKSVAAVLSNVQKTPSFQLTKVTSESLVTEDPKFRVIELNTMTYNISLDAGADRKAPWHQRRSR